MHYNSLIAFFPIVLLACVSVDQISNATLDKKIAVDKLGSFCLRHTGPQDKPLPTVCFVKNETVGHSLLSENYVIQIETAEIEVIQALATSFHEQICLGQYGSYATIEPPEVIVCGKDMKRFLQMAMQFANPPRSNSIDELLLRI